MEFAKKFTLIPEETLPKHTASPQQLSEFDKEMSKILNNRQLSEDEKVKLYYQILQQKLNLKEYNSTWTPQDQPESLTWASPEKAESPAFNYEALILETVPQTMRKHANNLLTLLKTRPRELKWNEQGEVIIRDKTLSNTNIVDLVSLLFSNNSKNVEGKEPFLSTLTELNIPKHYIRNKYLQQQQVKEETPQKSRPEMKRGGKNSTQENKNVYKNNSVQWLNL